MPKTLAIAVGFLLLSASSLSASSSQFKLVWRESGVRFYQRILPNSKEYITIVNLKRGKIANIIGVAGVTNDKLERKSLADFWEGEKRANRRLKVLVNGAFFSQNLNPSPIAFGLKVAGNAASYGYGFDEYPGLIRIWGFDNRQSFILPYKDKNNFNLSTPNLVGALDPVADKSADKYLPRTFVGIKDGDGDRVKETVIFYSSNGARQIDAVKVLDAFGAKEKVMLDGGSSAGLIVDGVTYFQPKRTIPHAIAIYSQE